MTCCGGLPAWPELRHNTSRGASAAGLVAVDGPYDDIRDMDGYRERMTANRAKGMSGNWSLTPSQVVAANTAPLPPESGEWLLETGDGETELVEDDGQHHYTGTRISLQETGDGAFRLSVGSDEQVLDGDELREQLVGMASYVPDLGDIVDSMEEFEAAKEAGKGAIAMRQTTTIVIDGIEVDVATDRMWDEATYQAARTPVSLFQDVHEHRPDQHQELVEMYGDAVVNRATKVGN